MEEILEDQKNVKVNNVMKSQRDRTVWKKENTI